jgi:hypothetical protein
MERYTVTEAAWLLGVGTDAIRKRVQRDTIKHERINGTVYVWLDADETRRDRDTVESLMEAYRGQLEDSREQIEFLRRELERKDAILLTMAEGLKALESPEQRESPVSPSEEGSDTQPPPDHLGQEKRSWWRKLVGG